ncbi:MAG: ABC transporter permease [Desulfohalobiaceae bacterium]|nr:ABC transporter permease [Desulfohalobiaceae bacterium]
MAMPTAPETQKQPPLYSPFREFRKRFAKNRLAVSGLVAFALFFVVAVSGVFLTTGEDPVFNPSRVNLQNKLLPPLSSPGPGTVRPDERPLFDLYLLGTDELGRDVFSRMLQGAWVSLTVGFVAVGISVLVGIFLGGLAGYFGPKVLSFAMIIRLSLLSLGALFLVFRLFLPGLSLILAGLILTFLSGKEPSWDSSPARVLRPFFRLGQYGISVDTLIMRFVDIMLCFPSFFLILTVIALLPASIYNIMVVIGLTSWMGTARFIRAEFLSLREQDFVLAARVLGVGSTRIIFRHMLPNAVAPVLVSATIGIATAILTEAGLSFLGFGVPPPQATWGNILSQGKQYIFDAPWLTLIPGFSILVVVLAFNLFGEGLRDALNPRLQD